MRSIKAKPVPDCRSKTEWTKEEWFCRLVDSEAIVPSLREIFNNLDVCRYNIVSSLFTIVLFGKKNEEEFFEQFMKLCSNESILNGMPETIVKHIFKYYGGVVINGTSDCVHIMAGNNMKSVTNESEDGTAGGCFKFGTRLMSVTAAHVIPQEFFYKVAEEDVAFFEVESSVESV